MSGVTLRLDTATWRAHLRAVADATPGLVPVIKGNGYGFGMARLASEAQLLGMDTLAVGLPSEVVAVRDAFDGDIVILNPWRQDDQHATELARDPRIISTVSRLGDLEILANVGGHPRVLCEALTSMHRHGINVSDLPGIEAMAEYVRIEGWSIHLPMAGDTVAEAIRLAGACRSAHAAPLWLSHFPAQAVHQLPNPDAVRLRHGTQLWLGDPVSRRTTATVLDVHRVRRGDHAGYRQRRIPHDGWIVVVSGGTSQGVGLEAPSSASTPRQRAISVATGGLAAAGRALSPYTIDGRKRWFVEPPHMQSSLVLLPDDATPPDVGDEVPVELRLTTAMVDQVVDA